MSTPTPVQTIEAGALAWFKKNWMAYGSGAGTVAVLWYVVHKYL